MHSLQNDRLHSMNWSWMFEQWPCAACHHLPRTHTRTHALQSPFSPPPRQCKDWLTRHVCKPGEVVKPEEGQPSRCCDNERNASVLMMWLYAPSWLVCEMPRRRWCGRDTFIKWPQDLTEAVFWRWCERRRVEHFLCWLLWMFSCMNPRAVYPQCGFGSNFSAFLHKLHCMLRNTDVVLPNMPSLLSYFFFFRMCV